MANQPSRRASHGTAPAGGTPGRRAGSRRAGQRVGSQDVPYSPRHAAGGQVPSASHAGGASARTSRPKGRQAASASPAFGGNGKVRGVRPAHKVSASSARATRNVAAGRGAHGQAKPPKRRSTLPRVLLIVAICAVVGIVGSYLVHRYVTSTQQEGQPTVESGQMVTVTIPDGSGEAEIAQLLKEAGVISDTTEFYQEVQRQDAETRLKSGSYDLLTGATLENVVRQLVSGPNSSSRLSLAEGLTVDKTAASVEGTLGVPADEFKAQAKASNYSGDYPFLAQAQDDSLEGYLWAATYDYGNRQVTADAIIREMLDQYQQQVATLDLASAEAAIQASYGITLSDYDLLKVASIIEREALTDDDRTKIASVIYNRLRDGKALQCDATMGYVTGGEVSAEDNKVESPYNTYLNQGLPPTPICTPSMASIQAAMAPASTNYYFFWITESEHVFSETYEQHQQAIANATS